MHRLRSMSILAVLALLAAPLGAQQKSLKGSWVFTAIPTAVCPKSERNKVSSAGTAAPSLRSGALMDTRLLPW